MNDLNKRPSWRSQFALVVVALIAAVCSTYWISLDLPKATERMVFWGIVVPWSAVARVPGTVLGEFLGGTARRSLGWFAGVVAGSIAVLILNYVQSPDLLMMLARLQSSLLPPSIIFGMLAATITESALSILEMFLTAEPEA